MSQRSIASSAKGISLIEMIIAMAIIAIITATIIPAYFSHHARVHRSNAEACLLDLMRLQEAYFTRHHRYSDDLKVLGYNASSDADCPGTEQYRLSAALIDSEDCSSNRCYRLIAIPVGRQAGSEALYLSYDITKANPGQRLRKELGSPGSGKPWP